MDKKIRIRIRIRDEHNLDHISEGLKKNFGDKILNTLIRNRDPGWEKFGHEIRDNHPGYATVLAYIYCIKHRNGRYYGTNGRLA
jgi:hypothetical protein